MKREPARLQVKDEEVERAIDEVRRSTVELVRDPFLSGIDITITLVDTIPLTIRHHLGRKFVNYSLSAPTGATATGRIVETTSTSADTLILTATGHGATITVRLRIW